jgi:VWFA-related protein
MPKSFISLIALTSWLFQAPTFFSHSDLVVLRVSASDRHHQLIAGLTQEDFIVREDGQRQTISHFSDEDLPVTVGLVVDSSSSMAAKRSQVITAGLAFASASHPDDEFFVVEFNDVVRNVMPPAAPFTHESGVLSRALLSTRVGGRTALYDAVAYGLEYLKRGERDQKALVVVSDGRDTASALTFPEVAEKISTSPAVVYPIGMFEAGDPDANPGLLRRMAALSGGDAFFPKDGAAVRSSLEQIARDIRTSYTIGYTPTNSSNITKFRKVEVTLTAAHRNAKLRHRNGYVLESTRPEAP